jgi:hypothetical protein
MVDLKGIPDWKNFVVPDPLAMVGFRQDLSLQVIA